MKLTNTACLAALLLACPLAATAVHGADYDVHYNDTPDASGKVASSGYKETPTGEWGAVYIGHAEISENENEVKVESSNNEGIIGEGLVSTQVYGGYASSFRTEATVQANANTLSVKNGVRFIDEYRSTICGGFALDQGYAGDIEACQNTVIFETGVACDYPYVMGGLVSDLNEFEGNAKVSASGNTVIIKEGFEGSIEIAVGYVNFDSYRGPNNIDTVSASDNKLYISNPSKAKFGIYVSALFTQSGEKLNVSNFYANNNYGELVLNENTELTYLTSVSASVTGNVEANSNSLYVTGGKSDGQIGQLSAAEVDANDGNVTVANNTLVLTDVYTEGPVTGADAKSYWNYKDNFTVEAKGNTVILNGGTYGGLVAGALARLRTGGSSVVDSAAMVASNNRIELRTGSNGAAPVFSDSTYIFGGYASNINADGKRISGTSTGNSLNFYDVKGMKAGNIGSFQTLNYEYQQMRAGDVIMELTGAGYSDEWGDVTVT